jgi:diguanylate cyclase (GGDEF)-like protein
MENGKWKMENGNPESGIRNPESGPTSNLQFPFSNFHSPTNLALLLLAIDSLARLRAEQGTAAAEFVLCSVAGLLRRAVRSRDVAARYEEDTFAILMPGTDWDNARAASRRLQALLQQSTFMYGEQELQVRTRFGLSHTATADARRPALLSAAQRGLEEAGSEERGLRVEITETADCRLPIFDF